MYAACIRGLGVGVFPIIHTNYINITLLIAVVSRQTLAYHFRKVTTIKGDPIS